MNAKQRVLASQCGQSVASAVFASALSDCRCRRSPKERSWSQHPLGIRRMSVKGVIQAGLGLFGLRLIRLNETPLHRFFAALKARGFSPRHIIDIGANRGYWTRGALKYFPEAYYTLIELQDHLKRDVQDLLTRKDGKIQWIGAGVSNAPGTLPFTISYRDVSSSFAISSESAEGYGMRQIMVPVLTLNEVVRTSRAPFPEMVKIDAEGFDLRVIEGSSDLLGKTDIFLLEALIFRSNTDKTEKQLRKSWDNLIETAIDVMSHAGYHIIDITDLNRSPKYGVLWLCEVAFLRNESSLLAGIDSYE